MAEEKVSKKILEDAAKRAAEIKEEGKRKAGEIDEGAVAEKKGIEEKSRTEATHAARAEKERLIALAKLELRKSLLAAKRHLVDDAFEKAVSRLSSLEKGDYEEFVKRLLLQAVDTGDEEVIVSPGEDRLDKRFLDKVNGELDEKGGLKLSEERRETKGGFILKRGRIEVKATFDSLVDGVRDELEMEVAKILFG